MMFKKVMRARLKKSIKSPVPAVFMTILSFFSCNQALAWGASGHRMISQLAIENLPPEIPAFLRTQATATLIGELGREPDRSRGAGNSHDHDLDPGHYIGFEDDFSVAGVSPLNTSTYTREDYDTALRVRGTDEYKAGFLPYSIVDGWQQLQKDFAYWRADVASEKMSMSLSDHEWFIKDRRLHEMTIIRDLGYWSHFVADASQPHHVSIHHDNWGDYSNPQGYAKNGFHATFEGYYVASFVTADEVSKKLKPVRKWDGSIQERTTAYLHETHAQLVPLFELEKSSGFSKKTAAGVDFTADRIAAGVSELRDMIIAAWQTSIDASVGYPAISVIEIESGSVNPIRSMQGLD